MTNITLKRSGDRSINRHYRASMSGVGPTLPGGETRIRRVVPDSGDVELDPDYGADFAVSVSWTPPLLVDFVLLDLNFNFRLQTIRTANLTETSSLSIEANPPILMQSLGAVPVPARYGFGSPISASANFDLLARVPNSGAATLSLKAKFEQFLSPFVNNATLDYSFDGLILPTT